MGHLLLGVFEARGEMLGIVHPSLYLSLCLILSLPPPPLLPSLPPLFTPPSNFSAALLLCRQSAFTLLALYCGKFPILARRSGGSEGNGINGAGTFNQRSI